MPQSQKNSPQGFLLKSTAYILTALAFVAGLLIGSLVPSFNTPPVVAQGPGGSAPQTPSQADQKAQEAEHAEHIAQVRDEIARAPEEPLNWIHLGNLYFDSHQPEEAIQAYQTALRLQPGNADVLTDMGTMHRLAGDPQSALRAYDEAIAAAPSHQNARYNKGVTLIIDLGQVEQGVAAWKALLQVKPDASLSGGVLLAEHLADILVDAGGRLEQMGKNDAALKAYDAALLEKPGFQPAMAHKNQLLQKQGAADKSAPQKP